MIRWIKSLFEGKPTRKSKIHLSKEDVKRVEEHLGVYTKDTITQYFNISEDTYYRIRRGEHKHSTRRKNE